MITRTVAFALLPPPVAVIWTEPSATAVSTPFASDYGEFALHYSYNYPEMLKIVN